MSNEQNVSIGDNFSDENFEVERKFEVDLSNMEKFDMEGVDVILICQAYFKENGENRRIRLQTDVKTGAEKSVLCDKKLVGYKGNIPVMKEIEVDKDFDYGVEFIVENNLKFIVKDRMIVNYHGFKIEIDFYNNLSGDLEELVTAEVEFKSQEELDRFDSLPLPIYFGKELTGQKEYSNHALSKLTDDTPFPYQERYNVKKKLTEMGMTGTVNLKSPL